METTTLPFVTARIDLQGLSHDLGVFKDKLEDWADRVVVKTETEKMEHANELRVLAGWLRFRVLRGCLCSFDNRYFW